jgi:hypothetical protein
MKKILIVSMLTVSMLALSVKSQGQISFSVTPGLSANGATFGYVINDKVVPYVGIQFMKVGFNTTYTGMTFDYDINTPVEDVESVEVNGSVFAPTIGIKAYIFGQEKLKGYLNAAFSKPFISGKLSFDGEEEEEVQEAIDNLSLFGLQAGFGAEYFIDSNFSIAGEFGIAYMKVGYLQTYDDDYWNPNIGDNVDYEAEVDFNGNAMPTYSRISINFYF